MFKSIQSLEHLQQTASASQGRMFWATLGLRSLGTIVVAYLLADLVVSLTLPKLMQSVLDSKSKAAPESSLSLPSSQINYFELKSTVIKRNLFNQTGQLPEEEEAGVKATGQTFDINAACTPTKLGVTLVGIIGGYNPTASIAEKGVDISDTYQVGDFIIGSETAQIARITGNEVVINNDGRKECLSLDVGVDSHILSAKTTTVDNTSSSVTFDISYVESELGNGFEKIIQSANLVPNTTADGNINGFKMFAIKKGTLLDKAGFKDNDVLTQVNDTIITADQGFALYDKLLSSKEVTVHVLRADKPITLRIQVK
jgi:type II secretion system protein C